MGRLGLNIGVQRFARQGSKLNYPVSNLVSSFDVDIISGIVQWTDTNSGTKQYDVYSSTNGGAFTLLATTAAGATSYTDTGCKQNASVVYKVKTKGTNKEASASALATPLCWKTDQSTLTAVVIQGLNIAAGKTVTVNWGDGTSQAYTGVNSNITKNFAATGQYNISLSGDTDSITYLSHNTQSKSYGVISNWILPSTLLYFYVYSTQVSGDISGWILPSTLKDFSVNITQLSGDISGWILPSTLVTLAISSTQVSGDISGWILPSTLVTFNVRSTQVSGNISGWILPSTLENFYVYSTQLSGDISGWILPSTLREFAVRSTQVSGSLPQITAHATNAINYQAYSAYMSDSNVTVFRKAMTNFNISNQNVAFSTANIDKLLKAIADWYQVNAPTSNCTFNMSGANMGIPTGGASNADITRLVGYYTAAGRTATVIVRTS